MIERSEKNITVTRLFKGLLRGSFFIVCLTLIGSIFGLILKQPLKKTTYSLNTVIESEKTYEHPPVSQCIKILTTNKAINYLSEQLNESWECEGLPALEDNELFKSLSFRNVGEESNSNVKFEIVFSSSNKSIVYPYAKVISLASCTYLNNIYINDVFDISEYPLEENLKTNVNSSNLSIVVGGLIGFILGFSFSFGFDLFDDTILFKEDAEEMTKSYTIIKEKDFNDFAKNNEAICNGEAERKYLYSLHKNINKDLLNSKEPDFELGVIGLTTMKALETSNKKIVLIKPKAFSSRFFPLDMIWRHKYQNGSSIKK